MSKRKHAQLVADAFDQDTVKVKKSKKDESPEEKAQRKALRKLKKLQSQSVDAAPTQIQDFLTANDISYDPPESATEFAPVMSFAALPINGDAKQSLASFTKPTPVQSCAWGVALAKRDCVGIAETGSGKTLAFGLPAIDYLQRLPPPTSSKKKGKSALVNVLVVAPTRELAMQTHETLALVGSACGFEAVCIYGGVPKPPQVEAIKNGARIVVGTPGRIIDLCNDGALDLSQVGFLTLDEADRMLDKGFENDIRTIIGKTKSNAPASSDTDPRQTLMFSATWPASVRRLASDFMLSPIKITVGSEDLTASTSVHQTVIVLDDGRVKEGKLLSTLRENGWVSRGNSKNQGDKVLIFALYKKEASRIEGYLKKNGYNVSCLQGDMSQASRTKALNDFKTGETTLLVATDVAARGLDIPKVELVINVTFPLTIEDYIHRIGRTGRAGRKGKAITFFTADDKAHAGELQRVLRDASMDVPEALKAFGGTIKKKVHADYGAHYDETLAGQKGKKIVFE